MSDCRIGWSEYIKDGLPDLKDIRYKVNIDYLHDKDNNYYKILCTCDIIRSVNVNIKIPEKIIHTDYKKFTEYFDTIKECLIEDIMNPQTDKKYIEINGVKYYPKENGGLND